MRTDAWQDKPEKKKRVGHRWGEPFFFSPTFQAAATSRSMPSALPLREKTTTSGRLDKGKVKGGGQLHAFRRWVKLDFSSPQGVMSDWLAQKATGD